MNLRLSLSGEKPDVSCPDLWARFEGVGMIRSEFLLRRAGEYVTLPTAQQAIASYVEDIATFFSGRPVWYRTADLWTDEANPLQGIDRIIEEENPIIGLRGLRRGLALPDQLVAEARIVAAVARRCPNLHLLLPFVGDADEFSRAADILRGAGWPNRIGSMLEIPAAVLDAERLVAAGATNLMFGLNDLTCLLTGAERGSAPNNKAHRSVWWCIQHVAERIGSAVEWGIAGSLSPAILERAENSGVPYASMHYSELPELLHVNKSDLSDADLVRQIKRQTRARSAEFKRGQMVLPR